MVGKRTPIDVKQCEARLSQRVTVLRAALKDHGDAGARAASGPSPIEVHDLKEQAFEGQLASLSGVTREQMLGELAAAQAAVQRLHDGSYGRCGDCNREIGRERLLVQPSAERCLPCQERAEGRSAAR